MIIILIKGTVQCHSRLIGDIVIIKIQPKHSHSQCKQSIHVVDVYSITIINYPCIYVTQDRHFKAKKEPKNS